MNADEAVGRRAEEEEVGVYLGGAEGGEHEGKAHRDQVLAVVLLPDGGEVPQEGQGHPVPGLQLGAAQRLSHMWSFQGTPGTHTHTHTHMDAHTQAQQRKKNINTLTHR